MKKEFIQKELFGDSLGVHLRENNAESQEHLETNRKRFSKKCLEVLERLLNGEKLTVRHALNTGISSLPRRILDLKQNYKIHCIKDMWVHTNGSGDYKVWWIDKADVPMLREKYAALFNIEPIHREKQKKKK